MFKQSDKNQKTKIRTRLIAYYVAFAMATVVSVTYFAYTQAANSLRSTVDDKLHTVAELKMDSLNRWADEQQSNAIFLASLPELRMLSGILLNPESLPVDRNHARAELTSLVILITQRATNFQDAQIINPAGVIVISASPINIGKSQFDQPFFIEGQTKTFTQGFYKSDLFDKTTLTVATPLFDDQEKRVGVLALHFNMRQVDDIIREDQNLNEPIQSYLINRQRGIITDDPLVLNQYPEMNSPAIDLALAGGEGTLAYTNHNGIAVIGRYLWIENQDAALIVEIDEQTALAPARRLAINIITAGSLISIILVLVVIFLAQRITAPLRVLTETASRISAGDLDAHAPALSNDEVGTLAQAFNSMTEKLRQTLGGLEQELHERKQMESALRESEERFKKIFQSSPIAICITALEDGRLLDANYAYWDLSGLDPKTSIGINQIELGIRDNLDERAGFVEKLKQKHSIYDPDYIFKDVNRNQKPTLAFYELIQLAEQECILSMFYDMSAQKQTMQALQQSEARTRALLEAIPDLIFEISADGTFLKSIQPSVENLLMVPDQFINRNISDVMPEAIAERTMSAVQSAIHNGKLEAFEYQLQMNDRLYEYEARIITSGADSALAIVRDITQRKWVEAEREKLINSLEIANKESETLRESLAGIVGTFEFNEIIQRILNQIKRVVPYDTASVWRVEGNHQYIIAGVDLPKDMEIPGTVLIVNENNSAYPLVMGIVPYVLNNNVQEELPDFTNPRDSYVNSWLAVPLKTKGQITGLIALDGMSKGQFNEHHAELAITFANQVAIALENASLFSDLQSQLEQRRQLIAELEAKNAEAETLRESAAIVAAALETPETVRRILEQLKRVIAYDSASVWLVDGNVSRIIGGDNLDPDIQIPGMEYVINEHEPDYPFLTQDIPYILYDDIQIHFPRFADPVSSYIHGWLAIPLRARGKLIGSIFLDSRTVGYFTENDAQKAVTYANQVAIALENAHLFSDLQVELGVRRNLITELESKNSELERFTYTVSHDLKSPLFTIRGFLGYLEQDALAGKHERVKSDMQRITAATEKMQMLLNDLLELSRIGRLKSESVSIPFEELARDAVELVHGQIMARGIAIHIDANLPTIFGDRQRLLEVIQNLVDNASKFMGDQAEPRIEIGQAGEEAGQPVLYVRDNGIGILPEHHDRVFGLFNKLDVKSAGTGIGLALVKRIIEVHGGRIWVQSEVGKGTTFYFTVQG